MARTAFAYLRLFLYLSMAPDRMQLAHTKIFFGVPSMTTRTRWRFGSHLLFVTLCAWLTLCPTCGCFPHIAHFLDIVSSMLLQCLQSNVARAGGRRNRFSGGSGRFPQVPCPSGICAAGSLPLRAFQSAGGAPGGRGLPAGGVAGWVA